MVPVIIGAIQQPMDMTTRAFSYQLKTFKMIQNSLTLKWLSITSIRKYRASLLLALFGLTALLPLAAQQPKPGIFYSVTGNGLKDTSYLFGTYHLVKNSYLDELPAVKKAFDLSKGVVVEIITDPAEVEAVQSMGMLQNQLLTDLLDQPFRDSLDAELRSTVGAGLEQLNQFKPMNVTLTISVVHTMKNQAALLGKYTGIPLDAWFAERGKESGKTVKPLEAIREQMEVLFNSSPLDEQVLALKTFIRRKKELTTLGDELVKNWFDHDLAAMNAVYEQTLQLSGEEDRLIRERNNNWMKVIPQWIQEKSQFIAVGALHLGGEYGLVEQLRRQGYTVVPVKTK